MQLRRPLDLFFVLGALAWPVALIAFGGTDNDTGAAIFGGGGLLVLASLGAEVGLRVRDRRRAR